MGRTRRFSTKSGSAHSALGHAPCIARVARQASAVKSVITYFFTTAFAHLHRTACNASASAAMRVPPAE